ncbi:MAG: hypothetical protein ACREDM_05145 [Methylocella sp.]
MNARPSGVPDAGSMASAWASSFFGSRQAISALTSRRNQPMFYLGPAIVVKIILIRALPGSICPHEENKPFAVQ